MSRSEAGFTTQSGYLVSSWRLTAEEERAVGMPPGSLVLHVETGDTRYSASLLLTARDARRVIETLTEVLPEGTQDA